MRQVDIKTSDVKKFLLEDLVAFREFHFGEDNEEAIKRLKNGLRYALEHELTEEMKDNVMLYYFNGMNVSAIAKLKNENNSTISRSIARARKRLLHVLKYTDPYFLNCG